MHRMQRVGIGLVALGLVASGCYGPFNLTRRLYQWNGQVGTKWEREFVFILLAWAPVYGLAVLGDGIVFNSMEFWTGNNPVDPPDGKRRSAMPQTKRFSRGASEAVLTYAEALDGQHLLVQQFQDRHPAAALRIEQRDGITVGSDADGHVLFSAQSLPDGSVVIHDKDGRAVATYSPRQAERVLAAAQRRAPNN